MSVQLGSNIPSTGNPQSNAQNGSRLNTGNTQAFLQDATKDLVNSRYNSGVVNPYAGPTPKSLFYNAATYRDGNSIYAQYLFYSIVGNNDPNFIDNYYLSERTDQNARISEVNAISGASRNPSAGFLVRQTAANQGVLKTSRSNIFSYLFSPGDHGSYIIGGASAPYFWKDFLYCKYYGHIPNNHMITLRRFPSPMRDNLSLPAKVKNSDAYKVKGAGQPVAQAVTWWGGNTGNSLNTILGFSTGLRWESYSAQEKIEQSSLNQGIFKSINDNPILNSIASRVPGFGVVSKAAETAVSASNSGFEETTNAKINFKLRDSAETGNGPLSKFIWTSVDTVDKAYMRARGLDGVFGYFDIVFHYELTSAGEVNTKAAMIDILGNLLGLCTNYGQFLTPEIRYDNGFPAFNFPGGDEGLNQFYSDPVKYVKSLILYSMDPNSTSADPAAGTAGDAINQVKKSTDWLNNALKNLDGQTEGNIKEGLLKIVDSNEFSNLVKTVMADKFIENVYMPQLVLTGAPVGEWHLVVGNPCNPVAMIGNLICTNLQIDFGENLGPDDFPTELTATITMQHATERERGQIESMFNRGGGRLYQSSAPVYSNSQSIEAQGTTQGNNIPFDSAGGVINLASIFGSSFQSQ
jgi:hypothetical protein